MMSFIRTMAPRARSLRAAISGALALLAIMLCLGHVHAAVADAVAGTDAGADIAVAEEAGATTFGEVEFNAAMLQFPVDVSLFAQGNAVPAGTYRVDLYTNEEWKGRTSVRFAMPPGELRVALPCFDAPLLEMLGFDLAHLGESARNTLQRGDALCQPLGELFEGSRARHDSGQLKLTISAPQIMLRREARGYVDPSLWDNGISAGMLDYSYNGYRSQSAVSGTTSHYLGLRAGFNLGAWRLRYNANVNKNAGGTHYRGNTAYLERGIPGWKSRLTIGDTVTDGQVFDSVRFRGVRMDSDERMRPDSQRGFAPVVRGIAQSNAKVSITQLGQEIYQTNVPPGPFVIDDLYPTGVGGDLLVTITESDGSVHTFTIAYAGTAELVRPGTTHYTLAAGKYENGGRTGSEPVFVMGNLRHGLSNSLTGYTGLMVGEGYQALSGGLAFNLPIGALATDFTFANTRTALGNFRGSSVRATWAKILPVIGTNVTVASYRYSSQGYHDPANAFMLRDQHRYAAGGGMPGFPVGQLNIDQPKNRLMINASQNLPGQWGYFSMSASSQDYWVRDGRDTQYQIGWNRQLLRASLGLSASRTHNVFWGRWDNQYMLNVSMPLGGPGGMFGNSSYTHREDGQALNAGVSGTAGQQRQFGFGAFVNVDERDGLSTQYGGGLNGSWNASRMQLSANLSSNKGGRRQYGVSINGGVVAFGGGIILTPRLGDTIAIVEARDARGARMSDGGNVRLNRKGLAVVPHLQAYRQNQVSLDPAGLSTDIALVNTTQRVAPTAGAVALLRYETERGYSILLQGRYSDGRHLPFAASVSDDNGRNVGHISQGGQALLRVNATSGVLTVRWGTGDGETCQFNYSVPEDKGRGASSADHGVHDFRHVEAVCVDGFVSKGE